MTGLAGKLTTIDISTPFFILTNVRMWIKYLVWAYLAQMYCYKSILNI